ncbi:hypothetical protein C8R43DRAFT_678407, partial [Mycena crocata]
YIPSNISAFFELAKFKPDHLPLESLPAVPLGPEQTATFVYAKRLTPEFAFIHNLRCYYFGLAMLHNGFPSKTPGVQQISFDELNRRFYHTALLHDLGWTTTAEGLAHPAHAMSFELHGGVMAYDHLYNTTNLDAVQVGDVMQSIVLHTSQWPGGTSSANSFLMFLSVAFDAAGYDAFGPGSLDAFVNRTTVKEVEAKYPRGEFGPDAIDTLSEQLKEKPSSLITHWPGGPDALFHAIRTEPIVPSDD